MSHTTILAVWPGKKYEVLFLLSNSWGSAPPVWEALAKDFLGLDNFNFCDYKMMDNVFALWTRKDIPEYLRAVLLMTADRMYVTKENFRRAEKDIMSFMAHYPELPYVVENGMKIHGLRAYHWPSIALYFGQNPRYPALALHCTSVSPNPFANTWKEVEKENGEIEEVEVPFDWSTAYNLYAELDSLTK
jgi:hypothetical protein